MRHRLVSLVTWMAVVCQAPFANGSVIITEIMYNPAGTDRDPNANPPFNREWVEIYNTSMTPVDISGWQLGDSQDNDYASPFPNGTMLGPQEALVVTGDIPTFDANWGGHRIINRIQVDDFPTLANNPSPTNETVVIRDNFGAIRDEVNYDDSNGWPSVVGSNGHSIFVVPEGLSAEGNDIGTNWKPSSQGVYGARVVSGGGHGINHGSPGYVATETQPSFVPSPDAVWSLAVLPDTQNYAKNSAHAPIFTQMNTWIRDHSDDFNILAVLHEGDIVNNNNTSSPNSGNQTGDQQWANAQTSMSVLYGHVPTIMSTGNHDYGTTNAQNRDTQFNDYFKPTDNPLIDPAQGGILAGMMTPGSLENAYYEFTAPDGRQMLIFSLEWGPREVVVNWANRVASQSKYADHTAVLLTHAYLKADSTRYDWWTHQEGGNPHAYPTGDDTNDGEELWNKLVKKHGNFEMVLSGHVGGHQIGYLESEGNHGNAVHQMLFNSQFEANGGNGWIRLLEFLDDGKTVRVRTYSPLWDLYRTDANNEFEFEISALAFNPADFNEDGLVDAGDLLLWEQGFGIVDGATLTNGDADGDGTVDGGDFLTWQRSMGAGSQTPLVQMPEPGSVWMALFTGTIWLTTRFPT